MTAQSVSWLVMATGIVTAAVGITGAAAHLRAADRAYRRTGAIYEAMPEGWGSWFLGGFSGLMLGAHWLRAAIVLASWTMAGLCLMGLGLRLIWRA